MKVPDYSNAEFGGDRPAFENQEDELVDRQFGCPQCGERRGDYLAWVDDESENVWCQTCGHIYNLGG